MVNFLSVTLCLEYTIWTGTQGFMSTIQAVYWAIAPDINSLFKVDFEYGKYNGIIYTYILCIYVCI